LLIVYRSLVTMILMLITVLIEMSAARGIVAWLADSGFIGLSTYSTNILTLLVVAAGNGLRDLPRRRYHEERSAGVDRPDAFYDTTAAPHTSFWVRADDHRRGLLLEFYPDPYFQSLGIPAAIGVFIALIAALTLAPRC